MAEKDGVEVVWAYCPDDRSKQGTSEWLPEDVAKMKVREGLARWPERPRIEETAADDDAADSVEVRAFGVDDPIRTIETPKKTAK